MELNVVPFLSSGCPSCLGGGSQNTPIYPPNVCYLTLISAQSQFTNATSCALDYQREAGKCLLNVEGATNSHLQLLRKTLRNRQASSVFDVLTGSEPIPRNRRRPKDAAFILFEGVQLGALWQTSCRVSILRWTGMASSTCPRPEHLTPRDQAPSSKSPISKLAAVPFVFLTVVVVALAFGLGLMLGLSAAERATEARARLASPSRISQSKPPDSSIPIPEFGPASVSLSNGAEPRNLAHPSSLGDLVVSENGKVIFRLQSTRRVRGSAPGSKSRTSDAGTKPQPLSPTGTSIPSKSPDTTSQAYAEKSARLR